MPPPKQDPKKKKRNPTTTDVVTTRTPGGKPTRTTHTRTMSDAEVKGHADARTALSDMQREGNRSTVNLRQAVRDRYSGSRNPMAAVSADAARVRQERAAAMKKKGGGVRDRAAAARKGALTRKARGK